MSTYTINPKIQAWFDQGNTVEALVGEGDFFIGGATDRSAHDRLLVIRQLLLWAMDREGWDSAAESLRQAIDRLVVAGSATDAYDLVWCYLLVRRDMHEELPLGLTTIALLLRSMELDPAVVSADTRLKGLVDAVNSELPTE